MERNVPKDRRTLRTQKALIEALVALVREREWDAISVQMICDRADVARSSFYAHYQSRADLIDAAFAAALDYFGRPSESVPGQNGRPDVVEWLIDHISGGGDFFRKAQSSAGGQAITARFRATVSEMLGQELALRGTPVSREALAFVTGGTFAVIENWVRDGRREPADVLTKRLRAQIRAAIGRAQ